MARILLLAATIAAWVCQARCRQQSTAEEVHAMDESSLLQQPGQKGNKPHVIKLRRETVPIYRRGKIASFKTSYSGLINLGTPPQEFRVVFDTGSGNVVIPAIECQTDSCKVHKRYNMRASTTSLAIHEDGSEIVNDEPSEQLTIGFGTGEVTGEYVRDRICLQDAAQEQDGDLQGLGGDIQLPGEDLEVRAHGPPCVDMHILAAVEMSSQPFKSFLFDGILGLGLETLAVTPKFSTIPSLARAGQLGWQSFGIFLTHGDEGEESEIAFGGPDMRRLREELSWTPVIQSDMGYWLVKIVAVRIDGRTLDICKDGSCKGVVDSGTSHLGVPSPADTEFAETLTQSAQDYLDCRLMPSPEVQIEVPGKNISLNSHTLMRRLPLREGVTVGSAKGVEVKTNNSNETGPVVAPDTVAPRHPVPGVGLPSGHDNGTEVRRFCRPRMMRVAMPEPLGPKLFILGEPVLHQYYTTFDMARKRVGFGLINNEWSRKDPASLSNSRGSLPSGVESLLFQQRIKLSKSTHKACQHVDETLDDVAFVQVSVRITLRATRQASVNA